MNRIFPVLLASCSCLGSPSCGPSSKPESAEKMPDKTVVQGPSLVGRIASVPSDKNFVLIQSYGKWDGQTGQILTTRGPENRTANLRTTGERLGEFAAADIQSGNVEPGDAVYLQHVPKPLLPTPSPVPALPSGIPDENPVEAATIENVQKNN